MADLVDVRERYQLLAKLGSGGMADVFLAVQLGVEDFKRLVVLKRIHSHWLGQRDSFKMFIDEAQLVATLNHPHIVKIYDLTWMGSDVCIAMEYVDGESLAFVIRSLREQGERIPLPVVFKIVTEACDALSYVHAATTQDGEPLNLVHRDICPQNLLLDSNGYIKVIDFGIARSIGSNVDNTSPGVLKGKLPYLAPETLQQVEVDGRADIYALGLVLFELLTLRRAVPFEKEMPVTEVVRRVSNEPLPRASDLVDGLDPRLDAVLAKATHKESVRRFQTGAGFAAELRRVAEDLGGVASTPEVEGWFRRAFQTRIAQRREFERLAVRKASESPELDQSDSSPALRADRTADIGAFGGDGLGITRSSQWSIDTSSTVRFNPYLFALVVFALVVGGAILFHQLFWDNEPPQKRASVYVVTDNLFVRSTPPGADITIDGERVGNTGSAGLNLRVVPGREHVLELNLEGHEVYSLKFPGESFGQRRIDARLVPLALASHEPPVDAGRKRVQRKRRARRGRGRLKSKLLSESAPAELAADASAVAASDRHLVMAGLDTVAPTLDIDVDLDPPVAPEEALAAAAQPVSEANDSSEEQGDAPAVPVPPEDAAAAHPLAPVAAAKPPQPANAAAVVPPDEPVVQSTAEVMQRRRSGESPEYPRRALVDGLETTMEVRVVITPGGRIDDIEHLAGERMFRPSVERALRTWRFAPLVVGGRPVESTAVLKFVFKLDAT